MKEIARYVNYLEKNIFKLGIANDKEIWSHLDYQKLHRWSVENKEDFWTSLLKFYDVKFEGNLAPALNPKAFRPYGWFPQVKLNFAENLLRFSHLKSNALTFVHESGIVRHLTYVQLTQQVSALQNYLKNILKPKDVLAAYMPNTEHTVVAMLATTSLGATFTSTSCDFGAQGVVDRFGQTRPKVLVAAVSYQYNGKTFEQVEKIQEIVSKIDSIEKVILVDFLGQGKNQIKMSKVVQWEDILLEKNSELQFKKYEFSWPTYIMYSSGTTGKPKCMVHGAGGTLLQHIKELGLHSDLTQNKKIFFFTTCGWMMWNWLVSSLFFGAEIVLYEGSPSYPSFESFMNLIDKLNINIFGTGPKYLRALENSGYKSKSKFNSLEVLLSTGAPLLPEQFDYVDKNIKSDIPVRSISGGTDIIGCFMLGNPMLPVRRGEIQCLGLGMDVAAYVEQGQKVKEVIGEQGELICKSPFPSTPVCFLNDQKDELYKKAYFDKYQGVWAHGDFVTLTTEGGVIVHGRSDATLNPGGVRIGTAEIYQQTETFSFIEDALCVGEDYEGDVRVWLFLKLKNGETLTEERIKEIKAKIRKNTTPRHVPEKIVAIADIPYTRSGKKMELLVHKILQNQEISNLEALANPECVELFKKIKKSL